MRFCSVACQCYMLHMVKLQRANTILRCFQSRDPYVLSRAFKGYVRPILEFIITVWSPESAGVACSNVRL